ncbi:zinc-dependent alcohol dehydrogenase [Polyangium aurulentum]|uniref:zinc-dependent alcohol dehydrogenase n=1 Tax=Polyangium aurulentum TaxID=2567896 RepID=UPI00197DAC92|nr:alcohol dehydrogenase catalytic domain-containing protein [Polyangium aurulentum]UQA56803.1 alcohol dehydrogenase catalytic domain-containing protein [Polyangium aurulentum]
MSAMQTAKWPDGAMTAVQITAPGRVDLTDVAIPEPGPDGVLVRTSYVGLCGTDLELLHGTAGYLKDGRAAFPLVFGHEWCGRVAAVGEAVRGIAVGDRVVGQTMVPCGQCRMCGRGRRTFCERLVEVGLYGLQGAAAEYIRMPARSLTVLPDALSDVSAAMIEPAVTVVGGFDRVGCGIADDVVVLGTGTIGLLAVQLAARVARSVDVIGVDPAGLALAAAAGARRAMRPEQAERGAYSVVIEASGAPAAFLQSLELAEPGGRVAVIGVANEAVTAMVPGHLVLHGIDVFGIRHGLDYYDRTVQLFEDGVLAAEPLVAAVLPPEDADHAFAILERGRSGPPKVLLCFDDGRPGAAAALRPGGKAR